MDSENGVRKELEIVVEDVKHFGDATRQTCTLNTYNTYSGGCRPNVQRQNGNSFVLLDCL
jgi:hypothetical protein